MPRSLPPTCCQAPQEPAQGGRRDRLHLLAEPGQAAPAQRPEHLGVAPLQPGRARAELAVEHPALGAQPLEGQPDHGGAEAEPRGDVVGGERAVGARVAGDQVGQRVVDGVGERVGGAGRDGDAQAVAEPADVLDRRPALDAGHPDLDGTTRGRERSRAPRRRRCRRRVRSCDLLGGERAEQPEQVGDALGASGPALGREPLELGLELGQHLRVEQLAQLGPAEQLGEQPLVEGERRGPALGDGGVALVDELGDVPEQQAARERARALGRDVGDLDPALVDRAHQPDQGGQVVDVLEALAHRLEHDRERRVAARDLEQRRAALALLPQRAAPAGVAAREQQRPGGALAEPRCEQRRAADLLGDEVVDLVRARRRPPRRRAPRRRCRGCGSRCRRRRRPPGRRCRSARAAGR